MHLVGFIIRIFHVARSPERQTQTLLSPHDIMVLTRIGPCMKRLGA